MLTLPSRASVRALLALVTLGAEYLILAVQLDGSHLEKASGWWAGLSTAGDFVSLAAVIGTAGLVLEGPSIGEAFRRISRDIGPVEWRFALAHTLAYGVFAAASRRLFSGEDLSSSSAFALVAAWFLAGLGTVAALLRAAFGAALREVAAAVRPLVAAGLALGLTAWLLAAQSRPLWNALARITLLASDWVLRLFSNDVRVDSEGLTLGMGRFSVTVLGACSGMEGMGLAAVFVGGYLYRFRRELRFPASLLLLPAAVAAAWVANVVRIAVLVVIGSAGWPDIAFGGFHSKAGWFLFCTIGLAIVVLSRRVRFFSRVRERAQETENPTAAFVTPLLLLLVVGMLTSTFAAGVDRLYPLRVIGASLALLAHRDAYRGAVGRPSPWAVPIGALVFALWWWFTPASPDRVAAFHELFGIMSPLERAIWIAFRVVGACIVVPAAEELAFRGFLQRRLIAEDFTAVPAGTFGWLSFIATSLAFGALHTNWLLGIFAGAAYSAAVYARGRLADAILAHATTNALLALSAFAFGRWDFW